MTFQFLCPSSSHPLFSVIPSLPPSLIPPTISILEDDSQGVPPQQLVVVNNPEWLHLRVHVPTLLHTDGRIRKRDGEWLIVEYRRKSFTLDSWVEQCCLTWCQTAGHWGLEGSAGLTESLSSRSASDKSSWLPWSALPPWSYSEHFWWFPA